MAQVVHKTPDFWSEVGQWINTLGLWIPLIILGLAMVDYCLQACGFRFEGFGLRERIRRGRHRVRG